MVNVFVASAEERLAGEQTSVDQGSESFRRDRVHMEPTQGRYILHAPLTAYK